MEVNNKFWPLPCQNILNRLQLQIYQGGLNAGWQVRTVASRGGSQLSRQAELRAGHEAAIPAAVVDLHRPSRRQAHAQRARSGRSRLGGRQRSCEAGCAPAARALGGRLRAAALRFISRAVYKTQYQGVDAAQNTG